jgi:hypothetical protein
MMKMCFPSRTTTYTKLQTFDDYSEQFADDAPLRPYDTLESPSSSRRSSLTSNAASVAYDPTPSAKKAARELALGFAEFTYDEDQAEPGAEDKGTKSEGESRACEKAKGDEKSDKELPPPPRLKVVRFLQGVQDAMIQKPLPALPSL